MELYLISASALLLLLLSPETKLIFHSVLIGARNNILETNGILSEGLNKA